MRRRQRGKYYSRGVGHDVMKILNFNAIQCKFNRCIKNFNYKQWCCKIIPLSQICGFRSRNPEKYKVIELNSKKYHFLNVRARYSCVKVSVYEARSTKCVRQCCHIEGCCFFVCLFFCFVLFCFCFFLRIQHRLYHRINDKIYCFAYLYIDVYDGVIMDG